MAVLILPKKRTKVVNKKTSRVVIPGDKKRSKKLRKKALEECIGILKDWNIDPIKYQKKLRSEWDRQQWENI